MKYHNFSLLHDNISSIKSACICAFEAFSEFLMHFYFDISFYNEVDFKMNFAFW